jgi:hypothetical protein
VVPGGALGTLAGEYPQQGAAFLQGLGVRDHESNVAALVQQRLGQLALGSDAALVNPKGFFPRLL